MKIFLLGIAMIITGSAGIAFSLLFIKITKKPQPCIHCGQPISPDYMDEHLSHHEHFFYQETNSNNDISHEIWSASQLLPGEGIEDAVVRIKDILSSLNTGGIMGNSDLVNFDETVQKLQKLAPKSFSYFCAGAMINSDGKVDETCRIYLKVNGHFDEFDGKSLAECFKKAEEAIESSKT